MSKVYNNYVYGVLTNKSTRDLLDKSIPGLSKVPLSVLIDMALNEGAGQFLPLAGGGMTGVIDMGTHLISNMANPAAAQDAATKAYVDAQVASDGTISIFNDTGVLLSAGTLVRLTGWDTGSSKVTVALAGKTAFVATHVVIANIANGASGFVSAAPVAISGFDTSLQAIGDPVYLADSGGGVFVEPSAANEIVQIIGTVKTVNAVTGQIEFFVGTAQHNKYGSAQLQDGAIVSSKIPDDSINLAKLRTFLQPMLAQLATNASGGDFAAGTLVRLQSFAAGEYTILKANASLGELATHVTPGILINGATGNVFPILEVGNLNTVALAPGTKVFANPASAGGFTDTEPTNEAYPAQEVGTVSVQNAVTGSILFYPGRMVVQKIGTSNLQGGGGVGSFLKSQGAGVAPYWDTATSFAAHNATGLAITKGTLVAVRGYHQPTNRVKVVPVGADSGSLATHVVISDIADGTDGVVDDGERTLVGFDTSLRAVGDEVYLGVAGALTFTAPATAGNIVQVIGTVMVVDAVVGQIKFHVGATQLKKISTLLVQPKAITRDKIDNLTITHLGAPIVATDNAILLSTTLLTAHSYAPDAQPDVPRNFSVTLGGGFAATPGTTVTVNGLDWQGNAINQILDVAAGAGVYLTTKTMIAITTIVTNAIAGLGGGETIKVGVANVIALPHAITATSAIYVVFLGAGPIDPMTLTVTAGTNTSGIDASASTYNGVKQMRVVWNEAE